MVLRPDELSAISEIEQDKQKRKLVKEGIGLAASAGAGFGFGKLGSKILPYLSEGLPLDLAIKGINKVSPALGGMIKRGQNFGLDVKEGLDFFKDKIETKAAYKEQSIFEQLVGDKDVSSLNESEQKQLGFLEMITSQLESKGKKIDDPAFKKIRKKIMNLLKGKPSMMLEEASRDMGMQQQPQGMPQPPQEQPVQPEAMQQQGGPGQQALMAILQKIQAQRGM